jgi:hypothetical protein
MAASDAAAALLTAADMDVELAVDWPAWDLDLVLLIDVRFLDWTAAVGAGIG